MPSTVNGIGTTYYGTKNLSVRTGTCEFCRRVVNLRSYDTRLWFVVVFIPVIPLGRKRIFDQCPVCTKHRAMKANDYDDLKRARIVEVTEQFQADPSAQNALAAHATILQFREFDQADKFRKAAIPLFSKDVGVL